MNHREREKFRELLQQACDAAFECGDWRKGETEEEYGVLSQAAEAQRVALMAELDRLTSYQPGASEPHIVAFGTPTDGFEYVGPFASSSDALEYADMWLGHEDWWVIMLQLPAEDSEPAEVYRCKVCGEPSAGGFIDCCVSDDLPEPGEMQETGP